VRLAHGAAPASPAGAGDARALHLRNLGQPGQLYRNQGEGRFVSGEAAAGPLGAVAVSRGLAVGDVDGDGDADAVVAVNGGAARLLLSEPPPEASWVGLGPCPGVADAPWLARRVLVRRGTRAAARGAAVGGAPPVALLRRPHRDGSYASARDPRVVVGLGQDGIASAVELRGIAQGTTWIEPPPRRYLLWCTGR
jgi:hypothetical protein